MATVSKNKGNGKIKVVLTEQELNTVTIALALINHIDVEKELEEQGLSENDVVRDHLGLFEPFARVTKLYPQKTMEDVIEKNESYGESKILFEESKVDSRIVDLLNSTDNGNIIPVKEISNSLEKSKDVELITAPLEINVSPENISISKREPKLVDELKEGIVYG